MEFTVPKDRLAAALSRANNATDRRSTMPILAAVLLRGSAKGIEVTATDMLVGFTEFIPCAVAAPGSIAIKAAGITTMVRTLPAGDVRAKALDLSWLQLFAGRTEAKLTGMSAGDFPELPSPEGVDFVDVPASALAGLISKTLFSVSTDETRRNLNGALLESNGKTATMVSTDGHRLTKHSVELKWRKLKKPIIIPRRGLDEIRKLLSGADGDCSLGELAGQLFVRVDGVTLSVKLTDATFPPWEQVVPKEHKSVATVSRHDLISALRQATVIAPSKTQTVAVTVTASNLVLDARDDALGSVNLEVPGTWTGSGDFKIGLNGEYVIEALQAVESESVELRFNTELDPVVVVPSDDPQDLVAVVMPMRI